ncbi:MAG: tRNA (adenosine(37)-N6)-threonylcarbamoyltransferase complex dimerization subunit type 1 TsaB [Ruminococcaceae bacterium]|nr:tRNA (adenosine(37)-N6)-threonylcarbamoyltransferase complex dimerization subunit type 1 TsaB [Oscillospiraceae bacterium]
MKILAVDTSALTLSVALTEDKKPIAQTTLNTGHTHSETLLPALEKLMDFASWKVSDIDLFAVSDGPGSFTGVRIGVSFVKGLAFGGKTCVGVSTLEALAYNLLGFKGIISPVMDARRGQFYNALFESDGKTLTRLSEDRAISAEELEKDLEKHADKTIYLCGDGYEIARKMLKNENIEETPEALLKQNAYSVAMVALKEYDAGRTLDDSSLSPTYLRVPQAERERLEREKKGN